MQAVDGRRRPDRIFDGATKVTARPMVLRSAFALTAGLDVIVIIMVVMLTLLSPGANAQDAGPPQPHDEWSRDASAIERLLADRQCDKAWELLLKHIKMGNRQAFVKTAGAIGALHGPGLRLPGAPTDVLFTLRIMTIFAALALEGEHAQGARSFLPLLSLFRAPCSESFDATACHKYVHEQNIVPPLDVFLKEVDSYQSATKSGAFCVEPPYKQP